MRASTALATKAPSFLTSTARVAQALDWHRSSVLCLSLDVDDSRTLKAVAASVHPAHHHDLVEEVPSIGVEDDIHAIVKQYNCCGLVVAWPVGVEGRCGLQCGKTLHILEALRPRLPTCLFNVHQRLSDEDSWGRSPAYARIPHALPLVASQHLYQAGCSDTLNMPIADMWRLFCKFHWPELFLPQQQRPGVDVSAPVGASSSLTEHEYMVQASVATF